eukprot:4421444-Pleurochrysis_carterae.AAC.1
MAHLHAGNECDRLPVAVRVWEPSCNDGALGWRLSDKLRTFAFASAHIADKRYPLRTAMHTVASSESATSANDVVCCSGLQQKTRGECNAGGGRSGCWSEGA